LEGENKMINNALEWKKFDITSFWRSRKNPIFEEIDVDHLLTKYGPEGIYDLAQELLKAANEDVSDAINNDPCTCDDCRNSVYNCKCQ
jgi:hypothetical protein